MKNHAGSDIRIAIILLASGNGRRFGSNKLLHIMSDGRPMISSVIDAARAQVNCRKILVTQYEELASLSADFDIVMNRNPELGISHSMQLGISAAGDANAYVFCVCDQPGIRASTISKLIESFKNSSHGIVSLSWQGHMFNPKIFSSIYRDELLSVSGDTGGRQIISAHMNDLLLVEADSEAEVIDIDYRDKETADNASLEF
jgi:molybdenum cofactor cytidylyltransferase